MNTAYPLRIKLFITIITILVLVSNLKLAQNELSLFLQKEDSDIVTAYTERLEILRQILPSNAVVGYISDDNENIYESRDSMMKYFLTQYALSPIIVTEKADRDIVIGNYFLPVSLENLKSKRLKPDVNMGNGLILLKKETW